MIGNATEPQTSPEAHSATPNLKMGSRLCQTQKLSLTQPEDLQLVLKRVARCVICNCRSDIILTDQSVLSCCTRVRDRVKRDE